MSLSERGQSGQSGPRAQGNSFWPWGLLSCASNRPRETVAFELRQGGLPLERPPRPSSQARGKTAGKLAGGTIARSQTARQRRSKEDRGHIPCACGLSVVYSTANPNIVVLGGGRDRLTTIARRASIHSDSEDTPATSETTRESTKKDRS